MADPGEALKRTKAKKQANNAITESANVKIINKLDKAHLTYIRNFERARERWEALRRNKYYQDDRTKALQCYQKRLAEEGKSIAEQSDEFMFMISPEGQEIARQYGLRMPDNPSDKIFDPNMKYIFGARMFLDGSIVEIIPQGAVMLPVGGEYRSGLSETLRNERYLFLAIDLKKNKKEIMNAIEAILDSYLIAPKSRGASVEIFLTIGKRKISIYEIWDMKNVDGKGYWSITKELFPNMKGKSPHSYADNYDPEAARLQKKIKDAIKRASDNIQALNPSNTK